MVDVLEKGVGSAARGRLATKGHRWLLATAVSGLFWLIGGLTLILLI